MTTFEQAQRDVYGSVEAWERERHGTAEQATRERYGTPRPRSAFNGPERVGDSLGHARPWPTTERRP